MEMQKVPSAGYKIKGLWISGLQRRLTFDNALFPVKLLSSLLKSRTIIKQFKPDVVIGTGGFWPVIASSSNCRNSDSNSEQNSFPGITNKLLSKKSQ
jgi:UDP-N-acetylglucosamine--N-acetylmuramyl-(pentapeptide) pyrophosphoryl-undecaprenol N-acetylglucosamine transferase